MDNSASQSSAPEPKRSEKPDLSPELPSPLQGHYPLPKERWRGLDSLLESQARPAPTPRRGGWKELEACIRQRSQSKQTSSSEDGLISEDGNSAPDETSQP